MQLSPRFVRPSRGTFRYSFGTWIGLVWIVYGCGTFFLVVLHHHGMQTESRNTSSLPVEEPPTRTADQPHDHERSATERHKSMRSPVREVQKPAVPLIVQNISNDELDDTDRRVHERHVHHRLPLEFDSHFSLNDVNLNVRGNCGINKCFWPSVSNASHVGYLIASEGNYDGCRRAHETGKRLENKCGIQHLYLGPAVLVNITTALMKRLDQMTHNPSRSKVGEKYPYVYYIEDTCVVVQTVAVAPTNHLLYGTYGTKWDALLADMPAFRRHLQVPFDEFMYQLERERSRLKCALESERLYYNDFQGLIDTRGNLFHIDIDDHFWHGGVSAYRERRKIKHSLRAFDEMIEKFDGLQNDA